MKAEYAFKILYSHDLQRALTHPVSTVRLQQCRFLFIDIISQHILKNNKSNEVHILHKLETGFYHKINHVQVCTRKSYFVIMIICLCKIKGLAMAWKPILVKTLGKDILSDKYIKSEMEKIMKTPQKDFEDFVAPFRAKNRPNIKIKVTKKGNSFRAFTGVESNWSKGKKANASDKFMFLTRGTSVRYATMSPDFVAKTSNRVVKSMKTRGNRDPLFVSTAYPQPGIEPREIEEEVRDRREGKIKRDIRIMFYKGILLNKLGRL